MGVSFHNLGLGKTDLKVFELLSRAALNELELEFDYQKPQAPAPEHRRIRPYHLANRENLWYLVGYDLARQAIRSFALPRMTNVVVTEQKFTRPADFSPDRYFGKTFGAFVGVGDYAIRIRFDADAAGRVRERFWHESQEARELPGGGLELSLHLGDLEEITAWVLSWGSHAEALAPAELRKHVRPPPCGWHGRTVEPDIPRRRDEGVASPKNTACNTGPFSVWNISPNPDFS